MVQTLIVILLLGVSLLLGYLTDIMLNMIDRTRYPLAFSEPITELTEQYLVPDSLVYALIKCESNFASNHITEEGRIGLMSLSEETFLHLTTDVLGENLNEGLLYDPETNLRYGIYYLFLLFTHYGDWELSLCAYLTNQETTDRWLDAAQTADKTQAEEKKDGTVSDFTIPDKDIRARVNKIQKVQEKYEKLYKGE